MGGSIQRHVCVPLSSPGHTDALSEILRGEQKLVVFSTWLPCASGANLWVAHAWFKEFCSLIKGFRAKGHAVNLLGLHLPVPTNRPEGWRVV